MLNCQVSNSKHAYSKSQDAFRFHRRQKMWKFHENFSPEKYFGTCFWFFAVTLELRLIMDFYFEFRNLEFMEEYVKHSIPSQILPTDSTIYSCAASALPKSCQRSTALSFDPYFIRANPLETVDDGNRNRCLKFIFPILIL